MRRSHVLLAASLLLAGCATPTRSSEVVRPLSKYLAGVWEQVDPIEHTPAFLCSSSDDPRNAELNPPGLYPLLQRPPTRMRFVFLPAAAFPEVHLATGWLLCRVQRADVAGEREYLVRYRLLHDRRNRRVEIALDGPTGRRHASRYRIEAAGDDLLLTGVRPGLVPRQVLRLRRLTTASFHPPGSIPKPLRGL